MKTAVEWLAEALAIAYKIEEISLRNFTIKKLIKQAKGMGKEQICNSYSQALIDLTLYEDGEISDEEYLVSKERAEQYYNETFKSE
jgi:hypothetical protein